MSTFLDPISKPSVELLKPKIIKRFKEGRGNGEGKTYKPFLEVRDVPSSGRIHRLPSITHGRIVHLGVAPKKWSTRNVSFSGLFKSMNKEKRHGKTETTNA